jgi:outer membrane protein TolC
MYRSMNYAVGTALVLAGAAPALAQGEGVIVRELSLDQAVAEALAGNSELAIAGARRDIAASQSRTAGSPLWPRLDLEAGYVRSTDPVAVFGTKLRQGRFGPEDLDFETLNNPDAIGDWSTAFGASWSLLDPKVWAQRSSAKSESEAAGWAAERTREATVLRTRMLYYRTQSAAARLEAAASAVEAAEATLDSFGKRRNRGLLTDADFLQAEAELAAARAQQVEAERQKIDALQDLARHLGWGPDTIPELSDELAVPSPVPQDEFEPSQRSDLKALAAAADAAAAAKTQASLRWIPAIDVFARYAWHSQDAFAFEQDNWTFGALLRWTVFDGLARSADNQRASLQKRIAEIEYEQAVRDAEKELDQALRAVRSARMQVEATQAASEAADSGRDLMRRRFDEGLATAADILQAEARATAMRHRAIDALAGYHMAVARLDFIRTQSKVES